MRKYFPPLFMAIVLGTAVFSLFDRVRGQDSDGPTILWTETDGENVREITGAPGIDAPEEPNIGFIDSPSATCYQPDPGHDACFINWYYLAVDASPNYMITMTVTLNDFGPVAHTQGFFQTSMYMPYNMLGDGFQVACGPLGAGGNPTLGESYAYTIRARDSAGLGSANYGMVYCPAYNP